MSLVQSSFDSPVMNLSNMPRELALHHTQSLGGGSPSQSPARRERKSSISFSAIGFMVESMHRLHNRITDKTADVEKAVSDEDVPSLKSLCSQDEAALTVATFATLKEDKDQILESILDMCSNHGLTGQESSFQDRDGEGLLHAAVRNCAERCVAVLLDRGFSANRWNSNGTSTPMHHAASGGLLNMLKMLQSHPTSGGNLDTGVEKNGGSVLHAAVRANQVEIVRYLLENKANKMGRGKFTETPLHSASEHNHHECAQLLLEDGILVDALRGEERRETALHMASVNGYVETVTLLLKHSADPNAKNKRLETPLHLGAKCLCPKVMKALIDHGSDVDSPDCEGRPPLHFAINSNQKGGTACMQVLIDKGADLNKGDDSGLTALHLAALNRKQHRVKLLIRNGADLCMRNKSGKSALNFVMKYVPNSLKTIEERMDCGLQLEHPENECDSKVKMNFNLLIPSRSNIYISEVGLFTEILKLHSNEHSRLEKILMHPLALAFLHLKWQQVKWLYYILILFSHLVYAITYSIYTVLLYNTICKPETDEGQDIEDINSLGYMDRLSMASPCDFESPDKAWAVQPMVVAWIFLIVFNIMYLAKETTKLLHLRDRYFKEWESILNLMTIITFPLISLHTDPFQEEKSEVTVSAWQFHAAGIGVFITWVLQLFLIGKVPKFGKYVQMLMNVGWSFFNFFVAYSSLLIGFALSFVILFPREISFSQAMAAPIKVSPQNK